MARTAEGEALTEAHRGAQATISAAVMKQILLLWRVVKAQNVKGTFPAFLELAIPFIMAANGRSADLGRAYVTAFREAEGVPGQAGEFLPVTPSVQQISTSLFVTGPVAFLSGVSAGKDEQEAMDSALTQLLGSASRLSINGGRDAILGIQDTRLVGYARVTSGRPCAFCALLASRGPVYSARTAGFDAHDACHCQPEPVYSDGTGEYRNPGRSDEFRQLYNQSTAGLSGADVLPAFRRAFQG